MTTYMIVSSLCIFLMVIVLIEMKWTMLKTSKELDSMTECLVLSTVTIDTLMMDLLERKGMEVPEKLRKAQTDLDRIALKVVGRPTIVP